MFIATFISSQACRLPRIQHNTEYVLHEPFVSFHICFVLVGRWRGYLSGARCRLAYGPVDAAATHCLLLQ